MTLDYERMTTIYKRRWKVVEEYHKSEEIERLVGEVADQNDKDSEQPCIRLDLWVREAGASKGGNETQSLRVALTRMYLKAVQAAFAELQSLRLPAQC